MNSNQASLPLADILVVDDTPDNLRLLSVMLTEHGYKVRKVINGQLALTVVQMAPPDLILLDINMPIMNGYEVCQKLKSDPKTQEVPIIFLSALDEALDKVNAFAVGGVDYITKPFQLEEVLARIEHQLKLYFLQKQLNKKNVQLQQEIQERQKTEAEIQLLLTLTQSVSLAPDFSCALGVVLSNLCAAIGFSYGEAWTISADGRVLECSPTWYLERKGKDAAQIVAIERFRKYSEELTFRLDEGLPGRVWNRGQSEWILDVSVELNSFFLRASLAKECGLKTALGVPIITSSISCGEQGNQVHQVLAVLVFFLESRQEDERVLKLVQAVAAQLARVMQQKQAEEALRVSEEKFSKAFRCSPDSIAIATFNDGRYIEVNDSFLSTSGYTRNQVIGHTASELNLVVNPKESTQIRRLLQKQGVVRNKEFNYRNKLGMLRTVLLSAELIELDRQTCILTVCKDITERKQIEEQLIKSEERWQLVIQGNNDGIWDWNLKTNEIFFSPRWKEILGYKDYEMVNCSDEWTTRIHPDDFARVMTTNQNYLQKKSLYYSMEYRLRCKDSTYKWVMCRGQALWDKEGKPVRIVGSTRDITQSKQAAEALQQSEAREREKATQLELTLAELKLTQAQLIQSEKMSCLGQMIAGVAHEINNPMSFIYGNLTPAREYLRDLIRLIEIYQQTYPNPTPEIQQVASEIDFEFVLDDWQKLITSMEIGAERIQDIVLSLRNFSRLDESELKLINIHEGIDNTLLIVNHRLKAMSVRTAGNDSVLRSEIQVIKNYGQLPLITCYASQLNQVFMNLLNNAIDALETQTSPRTITITTSVASHRRSVISSNNQPTTNNQQPITNSVISSNNQPTTNNQQPITNYVVIRIADNGPGMPDEVQQQIFNPFFTTKPVGKGTGLGLSIAYQIVVKKHGGQLSCISAPGQGTEFIVEIPCD